MNVPQNVELALSAALKYYSPSQDTCLYKINVHFITDVKMCKPYDGSVSPHYMYMIWSLVGPLQFDETYLNFVKFTKPFLSAVSTSNSFIAGLYTPQCTRFGSDLLFNHGFLRGKCFT